MKRSALGLAACLASLSLSAQAESSDLERAKESFKAGATAYAAGDYLAAIQALDEAYQLTPLPAIAFSLGQAERRQYFVDHGREHLDRAITLFRRYIELSPSGSRRADALDALSQLEPLVAARATPGVAPAPPAAAEARRTRVLITSEAAGARLALDDAPAAPSPLIREVEPGKHRLRVEAAGFFPVQREVTAIAGELILTQVPLRERPSTLGLWTPPGAEIYIDGAYVSDGGEGVMLQLASGKHRIAVGQQGHRVAAQTVVLERGKARSLRIVLEPTPQRLTSEVLFIAGGAALGASLVFSALAVRAEGRAEQFLGQRVYRNVSNAELLRYDSAIIDRDRDRLATGVCLAASAGFFITGLFLHELDQPNPLLLSRSVPHSGAERAPGARATHASRLQVAPVISGSGFGATLGGLF